MILYGQVTVVAYIIFKSSKTFAVNNLRPLALRKKLLKYKSSSFNYMSLL